MEGAVPESRARKTLVGKRAVDPETALRCWKNRPTPASNKWDAWEERKVTREP